jgi:hypothetical protein
MTDTSDTGSSGIAALLDRWSSGDRQAPSAASAAPPSPGASDRYFRMKQVKINDQGMNQMPAVDLMIPSTWQFKGDVRWGGGIGGCFADLPNFTPNGQLNGSWTSLQTVRPQP